MQKSRKRKNIVRYPQFPAFNIGLIPFVAVFCYMLVCLWLYATATHVTAYEVTEGSLSSNYRFTALALKTEKIVTADEAGSLTYYAREGSKIGSGSAVCSIGQGSASAASSGSTALDGDSLSRLRKQMASFARKFDAQNYQNVYNFQADLESAVMELTSAEALAAYDDNSYLSGLMNVCTASEEGILVLSVDGYENRTPETVTAADFDEKSYTREKLRLNEKVSVGDPIYKLLTSETWNLVIRLDTGMLTQLADVSRVKFRFTDDGNTAYADFSILQIDGAYYGNLELSNSLIRYYADRFVEIELLLTQKTGLKIPTSAIARKNFYEIPRAYCTYDEDSPNEVRLIRETYASDGSAIQKSVVATLYDKNDDCFYVDMSLFEEGDCVIMPDSQKRYPLSDTETLTGVYNINKGYAVFREVTIIDENEEYCIVEKDSAYGLAVYDHIALDASTVEDDQIIV